jgi:hypothetical protein
MNKDTETEMRQREKRIFFRSNTRWANHLTLNDFAKAPRVARALEVSAILGGSVVAGTGLRNKPEERSRCRPLLASTDILYSVYDRPLARRRPCRCSGPGSNGCGSI